MSKYWCVYNVAEDLRVNSIVTNALVGLRRDFEVAQNLVNNQLKTRVPSILQSSNFKVIGSKNPIGAARAFFKN